MRNCLRKGIRRMLCFVCILSLCLPFPASVTAEVGTVWSHEGLSFREIADNGWMVCDYNPENNSDTSLYIPKSYKVTAPSNNEEVIYTVRGIEDSVFGTKENGSNYSFSKVTMQASDDTTIGNSAFRGVQVETTFTVQSDGELKIEESAFQNAEIGDSIELDSLEECSIGSHAFRNMKINGRIDLYGSIDTLGDYAFSNLTCKGITLPNTIRNMGDGVFYNMNMKGATFPLSDDLESIGSRVFEGTGLKAIRLSEGNKLHSVAEDTFAGIEGTTLIMPQTVEENNIITIINLYHINPKQNLIIRIPSDLPAGSDVEIYLQQHGFQYQKGDEGEVVMPTPTPTATPTVSPTNTPESTPAPEPTVKPTDTPEPTAEPTDIPEPTGRPTDTPEPTGRPTDTPEPTAKPTDMPSSTGTAEPINTPSATPSTEPVPTSNATKKPNSTQTAHQPSSDAKPTGNLGTKVFQVKKLKYELAGKNQVTVTGAVRKKETSITIPNTVTIQGRLYRVTRIKAKAFRNLKKLKTVKVGNYVKVVEAEAFARCQGLSKIQFGTGLVSLGKKSLYQDKRLRVIIFKGTKLKKIGKKTFSGISPKKVSIRVKKSKMKAYLGLIRKAK